MRIENLIDEIKTLIETSLQEGCLNYLLEEEIESFQLMASATEYLLGEVDDPLSIDVYTFKKLPEEVKATARSNLEAEWLGVITDDPERFREKALVLSSELERVACLIRETVGEGQG